MGTYLNADKLYRKYGTSQAGATATGNQGGKLHSVGALNTAEFIIDLTTLSTTPTIIEDNFVFPKNARIESVEVVAHTAATSAGAATLDIGLVQQTDRSTAIDADGLVAAMAKTAIDTSGEKTTLVVGGTGAGALIGTTNATPGLVTANYGTAAFTAGVLRVRINWYAV